MNVTFALAIWGSLLSTILAFIKILEYKKDKADVKVTVKGDYKFHPTTTPYEDGDYILIVAANKGRRPVTLKGAGLLLPKENPTKWNYVICGDPISGLKDIELTEGKSNQYVMLEDGIKEEYGLYPEKYVACVWDATGRYYWSHNFLKRWLKLRRIK